MRLAPRLFIALLIALVTAVICTSNAQAQPALYVALGDSFSAGPGSGNVPGQPLEDQSVYEPGTNTASNHCDRSSKAYPALLASSRGMTLRNASCAGAFIDDVLTGNRFGEGPQIDKVTADASLVTITIGGNDTGFGDIVTCVFTTECAATAPSIVNANTVISTTLTGRVAGVLQAIRDRAPAARIVLGGYPRVLPAINTPALGCVGWLSNAEQGVINTLQANLNSALRAATVLVGGNIAFADPIAASSPFEQRDWLGLTRDACSLSATRAINGLRLDFNDGSFHPNGLGQAAYKQVFATVA
jgi:lysophospholipase L1-like esterase